MIIYASLNYSLISQFERLSTFLLNWCEANRLDINWSNTFAMYVTNKRLLFPKTIFLNDKIIEVVQSLKLLEVTIDNKLHFFSFVAYVWKMVNETLFSIKRLFFLHFSVRLQFFKSFILPNFDYCCSLFKNF